MFSRKKRHSETQDIHEAFSVPPSSPFVAYLEGSKTPLMCLYFILPFLILYHTGIWFFHTLERPVANGADIMLAKLLNITYYGGVWLYSQVFPGSNIADSTALWILKIAGSFFSFFFLIFILLFQHHLSSNHWKVKKINLLYMYFESLIFAFPPFFLAWLVNKIVLLKIDFTEFGSWLSGFVLSMGAGVYEEFLFRMIIMSLLFIAISNVFKIKNFDLYIVVMLTQAVIFSGFHYLPWSHEVFSLPIFTFRIIAGIYFGYLYQERGFAIAAGSHTFYDIIAETINDFV